MVLIAIAGAVALWMWPSTSWWLYRVVAYAPMPREARFLGRHRTGIDPLDVAAAYDLFAICLRAGLPVRSAGAAVAVSLPSELAEPLRRAIDLLGLGADAEQAWHELESTPGALVDLAVLARRSARSGASMAEGLAELAIQTRAQAEDAALAAAERAGVKISGPLGLCFLPAFVCLGIAPVVIGLAGSVLGGL